MKKNMVILTLGLLGILGNCNAQNNNSLRQISQQQKCEESGDNHWYKSKCYTNCIKESDGTKICKDTDGEKMYFLPESYFQYERKLEKSRNELEQLTKKYGEKKIINGEEAVYWDPDSLAQSFILYTNGNVQIGQEYLIKKEPLEIYCGQDRFPNVESSQEKVSGDGAELTYKIKEPEQKWGNCSPFSVPLMSLEFIMDEVHKFINKKDK